MWTKILIIGIGGFVGANARYFLGGWAQQKWGVSFPWGTLLINVSGSFILGLFAPLAIHLGWNEEWRLLIAIGFLGAYTTFSTFSYETLMLIVEGGQYARALANIALSVVASLMAAGVGLLLARLLLRGRI